MVLKIGKWSRGFKSDEIGKNSQRMKREVSLGIFTDLYRQLYTDNFFYFGRHAYQNVQIMRVCEYFKL